MGHGHRRDLRRGFASFRHHPDDRAPAPLTSQAISTGFIRTAADRIDPATRPRNALSQPSFSAWFDPFQTAWPVHAV